MGSTDVAVAMATGQTWLRVPATLRVDAAGELPPGIGAKDVALQLAGRLGAAGARYMAVEFGFPETLDLPARMTLCGMTTEMGAKAGLVVPDAVTATYGSRPYWPQAPPSAHPAVAPAWDGTWARWRQARSASRPAIATSPAAWAGRRRAFIWARPRLLPPRRWPGASHLLRKYRRETWAG